MKRLLLLGSLLLLSISPSWADEHYDPIAHLLPVDLQWTTHTGRLDVLNVLVTVPGPGTYDVNMDLPDEVGCPPVKELRRKMPGTHALIAIEAALTSCCGSHPGDGFTKVRLMSWGIEPRQYHITLYYCP